MFVVGPPYEDKVALEKADVEELLHAEENFPPRKFINMDLHNNIKENYKPKEFMMLITIRQPMDLGQKF